MFRFKSVILILGLVACNNVDNKTTIPTEPKSDPIRIVNKTDSILSYADKKLVKIKESKILNNSGFIDSAIFNILISFKFLPLAKFLE